MCNKFDIYVFIKERKNLTCNHLPVNFVNAIYQCYLNQIICLCTINIGSALFNSVFSNTIIFYSSVCYICNERLSSSQKHKYQIYCTWHFYGVTFIIYAQSQKAEKTINFSLWKNSLKSDGQQFH
jgi:hypothetical protein